MKKLIRYYLVETLSLYIVTQAVSGIVLEKGIETLFIAGLGLTAASLLVRPIVNLLLLPLNLVTFGLFRWISLAIAIYLVTLVIPGFKVAGFIFPGYVSRWFSIPAINLDGVPAYIALSLMLSILTTLLFWIIKRS